MCCVAARRRQRPRVLRLRPQGTLYALFSCVLWSQTRPALHKGSGCEVDTLAAALWLCQADHARSSTAGLTALPALATAAPLHRPASPGSIHSTTPSRPPSAGAGSEAPQGRCSAVPLYQANRCAKDTSLLLSSGSIGRQCGRSCRTCQVLGCCLPVPTPSELLVPAPPSELPTPTPAELLAPASLLSRRAGAPVPALCLVSPAAAPSLAHHGFPTCSQPAPLLAPMPRLLIASQLHSHQHRPRFSCAAAAP